MNKPVQSLAVVREVVSEMKIDGIEAVIHQCLDQGLSPMEIIEEGIAGGLEMAGEKFEEGTYFLCDIIMAGKTAEKAVQLLEERMRPGETGRKGTVVLATVQGDIHEIGKKIVSMILRGGGFNVIDLGVDVPPEKILSAVKETGARLVGLSALLSTMVESIKEVIDLFRRTGLKDKVKIVIGGACTSEHLKRELGADAYGENATRAVKIFEGLAAH